MKELSTFRGENNQIEELASLDTLDIYFLYSEANRSDFSIRAYTLLFYIFRHKCPAAPIVPMFFETKESVILQFKASGYTDEEINPNIDRYVINLLLKKQNSEYSINRTWNFSLDYLNAILLDEGYFNEGHLKKD